MNSTLRLIAAEMELLLLAPVPVDPLLADYAIDNCNTHNLWTNTGVAVYDEKTGRWKMVQVEPRVNDVKAGRATLIDPEGLVRARPCRWPRR